MTRRSTDALSINDSDISPAVQFIRDNACRAIGVKDVLGEVPLSRRALEGRFLRLLGRTPHQEIIRCRMENAKRLLRDTDLPVKAVALASGVSNAEYFSVQYKKFHGISPSESRDAIRHR